MRPSNPSQSTPKLSETIFFPLGFLLHKIMPPNVENLIALPPGRRLGEYRIERCLGSGGFGITYSAIDEHLDRRVAIKEYLPKSLAMRDANDRVTVVTAEDEADFRWGLDRFLDEARALARFDHPNIVGVKRFLEAHGTGYIVMEHVDGEPLSEMLKRKATLTEPEIREHVLPLAAGLSDIHAAGLLHRDIKPSNIVVRADGVPVLIDFGSARLAVNAKSQSLTAVVTPGYAPLEQYSAKGRQLPATDIYALGAVLYRCVTGVTPRDATERALEDQLAPVAGAADGVYSDGLLTAIDAALAMRIDDRPHDVDAFLKLAPARDNKQKIADALGAAEEAYNRGEYELALREFRRLAGLENPSAQYRLGEMYYYGKGVPESHTQACQWLTRAAEQGDVDAQIKLGEIYGYRSDCDGPEKHHLEVIKEAESGNDDAQYELGLMYESGNGVYTNDARALQWLTRAAERGHVDAQIKLGRMYRYNQDNVWECVSEEDHMEALHWYELAAEQGDADAQYESGCIRYDYDGAAAAVSWFKLAADQGHTLAQHSLGCMIADNLVSDDHFEYQNAVKWFIPAAEQGDAVAQYHLGCVLRGEEPDEAGKWFVHAADQGCVDAQYQLGLMCVSGVGVPQDHNQAIQWFARAAKQGHADALTRAAKLGHADSQYDLGHNYERGVGTPEDQTQAVWWYTLAAEQGHACAQYELGCMSRGAEPDEAVEWFTRAAEQGNADAQHALGKLYCSGEGVPQNHVQAVRWFSGAAKQGHTGAQFELGRMYANGEGVADNIQAFAWAHLASARGRIGAAPLRDDISANLSQEQLVEAQQLSRELEARIQNSR